MLSSQDQDQDQEQERSTLLTIPNDTFFAICELLSYNDILAIASTCRSLYKLTNDTHLWWTLLEQRPLHTYIHTPLNNIIHVSTSTTQQQQCCTPISHELDYEYEHDSMMWICERYDMI